MYNFQLENMTKEEIEGGMLLMQFITKFVKDTLISIIRRYDDPYKCWEHLKSRYEPKLRSRQLVLLKKIVESKKEDTISMEQYSKDLKDTIN